MTTMGNLPEVVSHEEWLAARKELLVKEKELIRLRDRVNADRRRLPMVRVDKPYTFVGPDGEIGLPDLFHGRPQLEAELAEAGTPWGEGWRVRGDYPGVSAFLRVGDEVFHTYSTYGRGIEEFHYGIPSLDLTALGRQEPWEEPKGRAVSLGLQVGSPTLRPPDQYDT